MDQWSLYNFFTSDHASKYGVTDLIHELILSLSYDVCRLKRNALTSYKLVSRAGVLYDEIKTLIGTVETETFESWDTYDKYTLAIAPLEDLLLKLCHLVDLESKAWLPTETKVVDLVSSVETWQGHQSQLRALFESDGFYSNTHLQALKDENIDAKPFRFRDNWTFLSALCRAFGEFELSKWQNLLTSVKQEAHKILPKINETTTDESLEQTIRSMMLVYGVLVVLKGETETDDCKAHLTSERLWKEAEGLLSSVVDHLSLLPTSIDVTALQGKVDAFITLLKEPHVQEHSGTQLPSSYWKLKKAVQTVRRPYHAQTLAAVKQTRDLADHLSKLAPEKRTPVAVKLFEEAVDAVEAAILATTSIVVPILSFDPEETHAKTTQTKFEEAKEKLSACFSEYKVKASGMTMAEAKDKDDEYVRSMKAHFNVEQKPRPDPTKINVDIIRVKGDAQEPPKSYSMDQTTSVSAILWKEADSDPTVRLQSSHFLLDRSRSDEKLHLEKTVHDVAPKDGKLTLYLVD